MSWQVALLRARILFKRVPVVRFLLVVVLCFLFLSLGKWAWYEMEMSRIRNTVGSTVRFSDGHKTYVGILKQAQYELSESLGFFSLRISIDGYAEFMGAPDDVKEKAGVYMFLEPWELERITSCSKQAR